MSNFYKGGKSRELRKTLRKPKTGPDNLSDPALIVVDNIINLSILIKLNKFIKNSSLFKIINWTEYFDSTILASSTDLFHLPHKEVIYDRVPFAR
jgi:hypothetical protein